MKKFATATALLLTMLTMLGGTAAAMAVSDPVGIQISGWYKDTFSVAIKYGTPTCSGAGTAHSYTFQATSSYNGTHAYKFISDTLDNPYLSLDNGPPQPLVMPLPCPPSAFNTFILVRDLGNIRLDALAPSVAITNPSGNVTTSASTYLVSGVLNDGESGIAGVHLLVNGADSPASLSGNTFSGTVTLNEGANTVVAEAFDKVGHSSQSASVTITRSSTSPSPPTSSGGSSSSSSSSSSTSSSSGTSTPSTSNTTSSSTSITPTPTALTTLKFNQQHVLSLSDSADKASDPNTVLADQGLASSTTKTYYLIILLILLLLSLMMIWRFRPIFSKLDKNNSGLRRRIIIIVTLPSLIPLFGLGFLGYQQLTHNVRATLSDQLAKAAQTSSLRLEREFAIRSNVITKTSSDILQIKSQIKDQRAQLLQQKDKCAALVNTNIPKKQYAQVTGSDDCLPFLTGFAQLASSSGAGVKDYQNALNQGEQTADTDLQAQEQQRVNELLGSVRHFFPDLYELAIVGTDDAATVQAQLPPGDASLPSVIKGMNGLLKQSRGDSASQLLNSRKPRLLLLTYPIMLDKKNIGGAVAAIDIDQANFMPDIWRATPKPYASDEVFFATSQGGLLYPTGKSNLTAKTLQQLALTTPGKVFSLQEGKQNLATRVSQVAGTNLAVAVGAPASSVLAPLAGIQQTALLAIICFILLSVILGIFFVSGIAGEIESLLTGALRFAKGELAYRIGLRSHDELQTLGETMDQMAADIKAAQEALIEKDKEFINVATHELKAPMTAIIGNLSMITEDGMGQIDETARQLIGQAYDGTVRLRGLVNDMLDVARLEAGRAEFKLEPLDITKEASAIVAMQAIPAQQANVNITCQPTPSLPNVAADKTKLQIILTNFVSNAIKYNRQGGTVTITHELKDGAIVTCVADTGLGIPPDQQEHIFEKFYRVSHEDRKNVPGTGLGMYITKRFIEAMGGKVWFESTHGKGTAFYFSLPVATTPPTPETPTVTPPVQNQL